MRSIATNSPRYGTIVRAAPHLNMTRRASPLSPLLERLRREHFPAARFSEPLDGVAVARHERRNFTSTFQPIVRAADGAVSGHQALLCAADDRGRALAPSDLFAHTSDEATLKELDRIARTLHAVNYFGTRPEATQLFMNVDPRLPIIAPDDHGPYFDRLLAALHVPASRVTLVLPDAALDDPVTFVRATISYRARGYRVLAVVRPERGDLEHVLLADPHYAAIDLSSCSAGLHDMVRALHARSIHTVARRIETGEQANAAREAGFGFLQGLHFAPPRLRASRELAVAR